MDNCLNQTAYTHTKSARVLKDNIYVSLHHPSTVCATALNQNGTHSTGECLKDHRTSHQHLNVNAIDISHKDNDNTRQTQPLLTDTILAE